MPQPGVCRGNACWWKKFYGKTTGTVLGHLTHYWRLHGCFNIVVFVGMKFFLTINELIFWKKKILIIFFFVHVKHLRKSQVVYFFSWWKFGYNLTWLELTFRSNETCVTDLCRWSLIVIDYVQFFMNNFFEGIDVDYNLFNDTLGFVSKKGEDISIQTNLLVSWTLENTMMI